MNSRIFYLFIIVILGIVFVFQMSVTKAENLTSKLKVRVIEQTQASF